MYKAYLIGLALAMWFGPLSALFVDYTLHVGLRGAIGVGLGIAAADFVFGLIGGLGSKVILNFLTCYASWFKVIGGILLVYLGVKAIYDDPTAKNRVNIYVTIPWIIFLMAFGITLSNPLTILTFMALFPTLGDIGVTKAAAGLFLGSATWWFILGSFVLVVRKSITPIWVNIFQKTVGLILLAYGLFMVVQGGNSLPCF